jgi:hypothetical protein
MRIALTMMLLAAATQTASAQSEEQLRHYFEGKAVTVMLDMPGSEEGVDVYPDASMPIDFPRHAKRLKEYGTAIRRGDEVLITKIRVKKDLIEFQLGGGGYGTFGDETSSDVDVPSAPKTQREKDLERDVKNVKDPAQLKRLKQELDDLRKDREREDARNRARVAQAREIKDANIRQRRIESGSRFNLRYKPVVPREAMTPEGVMRALAEYVQFSPARGGPGNSNANGDLRKGLTAEQVDELLGRPISIANRMEGTLNVSSSTYRVNGRVIIAEFVEGVLIRYTIRSE